MYTECTRRDRSQPDGGASATRTSRLFRAVHLGRRREIPPYRHLSSDSFASTGLLIRWSLVRVQHGSLRKPRFCGAFCLSGDSPRSAEGGAGANVHRMYTSPRSVPGKRRESRPLWPTSAIGSRMEPCLARRPPSAWPKGPSAGRGLLARTSTASRSRGRKSSRGIRKRRMVWRPARGLAWSPGRKRSRCCSEKWPRPSALAHDADGNPHQHEATVGRELTRLRPVLLHPENERPPSALA